MEETRKLETAVLLAGGEGTRLRPITYEIPKPLIPVKGKPAILWQIDMLRKSGIKNIIVTLGPTSTRVEKEISCSDVRCVIEKELLGTGGALNMVKDIVKDDFLVMNADVLFMPAPNIREAYEFHVKNRNFATILVNMEDDVSSFGMVRIDGSKVVNFSEKPKESSPGLINSGLYILNEGIFQFIKPKCKIEDDVFPKLVERGLLHAHPFNGRIFDTGTMERYERAIKYWKPYF